MTAQSQQLLETKIRELRAQLTTEQWADASYLLIRVHELQKLDIAFAFRLMQRVRNLSPTDSNLELLEELSLKVLKLYPELATSSSKHGSSKRRVLSGVKSLGKTIFGATKQTGIKKLQQPIVLFVVIPFLLFSVYQLMLASSRYESQAQLIVKEPNGMATLDPAMAIMSGFGIASGNSDTELVKSYIHSNDMLAYLERKLSISQHYSDIKYDVISRLSGSASRETQLEYFLNKVTIDIDEKSQVITIKVQAFESDAAHQLSQAIVNRAEWYINEIGRNLAKRQLDFVENEHALIQAKLRSAKSVLLDFQRNYNLLDPEAEGLALQQIVYQLEAQVAAKKAELRALATSMNDGAPLILKLKAELNSLTQQLDDERSKLTADVSEQNIAGSDRVQMGFGQILAKYSEYKINLELALRTYTSSLVSLEKSRIEAYRQLKYLVVVETPTTPDEASYPTVLYNLSLMLVIQLMLFGIGKIILATVDEMR
jgi:capsular polysaccharide transport system permease protein